LEEEPDPISTEALRERLPASAPLLVVGLRARVREAEPCDPIGNAPPELERDVAPHGDADDDGPVELRGIERLPASRGGRLHPHDRPGTLRPSEPGEMRSRDGRPICERGELRLPHPGVERPAVDEEDPVGHGVPGRSSAVAAAPAAAVARAGTAGSPSGASAPTTRSAPASAAGRGAAASASRAAGRGRHTTGDPTGNPTRHTTGDPTRDARRARLAGR